jgi:hypothetical protein
MGPARTRSPMGPARTVQGSIRVGYPAVPAKVLGTSPVFLPTPTHGRAEIGSRFPSVEIDCGFPPEKVNLADRIKGKRVILVGLPGAFTPT